MANALQSDDAGVIVRTKGLVKSYPDIKGEAMVLKGIDLDIRRGELITIMGPSGSGKSTFLNLLGLMDKPTAGELVLFGKDVLRLDEKEAALLRSRKLGFIFQFDSLLPEFTLAENVLMPGLIDGAHDGARQSRGALEKRARELLSGFGLSEMSHRFPRELSGGERQRAAIARALYNRPEMLLADEPTGNLDRENGELVFSDLRTLAAELRVSVVLVTHNEHAVRFADKSYHLFDGKLAEVHQ